MDRVRVAFGFAVGLALAAGAAAAQEPLTGVDAGGHISSLFTTLSPSTTGIAARTAVPVVPRIAIEGRVTLFPERLRPTFLAQGGRTVELQVGGKGAFIQRRRFSLYGVLLPGLVRFTDTITALDNGRYTRGAATHFTLDMGIGAEIRPARRWNVYAEWAGPSYAVRGIELGRSAPSPSSAILIAQLPASILTSAQFNAGLSYRFGSRREQPPEAPRHPRRAIGAQTGHTTYTADSGGVDLVRSATVGAFGSARILGWLDADAAFDTLLHHESVHSPERGGRVLQALAGVKTGTRSKHVGYFAKVRGGVRTRDSPVTSLYAPDREPVFDRSAKGVLDYGAVIESYVGQRLVVRVDAGDVMSFYGYHATDSVNVGVGIGWRLDGTP